MKRIFVLTMIAAMFCTSAEGAGIVYGADVAPVMAVQAADENPPVVISPNPAQDDSDSMPDMSNPFIGCDSLDEAGSIAGFSMNAPKKINGYGKRKIFAVSRKRMKKIIKSVINADITDNGKRGNVQLPNPIIEYRTMEEAAGAAGFSLNVPETIAGYKKEFISVISSDLIQVTYQDGENSLCIRKAAGDGDISGDYNRYDENKTAKIGNIQADMRGTDGKVSTAVWNREGFAYSVCAQPSVSRKTMEDIIRLVMQ